MAAVEVLFRFYEELNDYLPEGCRKRDFEVRFEKLVNVGKAIASLGGVAQGSGSYSGQRRIGKL